MRGALLTFALLLLPVVSAQAVPDPIAVRVEAPAPVAPLRDPVKAPVAIDLSCLLATPGQALAVSAWVASAPTWAKAIVSPATFEVDPTTCGSSARVTLQAQLAVTVNADAPAWTPGEVAVSASVVSAAQGNRTASGATNLTAIFFGILDVGVDQAIAIVAPGEAHVFPLRVANDGNDATRVSFRVENASDWMAVDPIPTLVLGNPKKENGTPTSVEVPVTVRATGGGPLTNRVGTFTVRVDSEDAHDPPTSGDATSVSFVVTERGRTLPSPAPATSAALLAVALAALARRAAR